MLKHAIVATKTELKKYSPPGGGRYGPSGNLSPNLHYPSPALTE